MPPKRKGSETKVPQVDVMQKKTENATNQSKLKKGRPAKEPDLNKGNNIVQEQEIEKNAENVSNQMKGSNKENIVLEKQEAEKPTNYEKKAADEASSIPVETVLQFTINLKRKGPRIWRTFQVPSTYTFADLHNAIQCCMGWNNCHLHEFNMKHPKSARNHRIGHIFDDSDYDTILNEDNLKIADYFTEQNKKAEYIYDFGIWWEHTITFDKVSPKEKNAVYPVCLSGKLACPPEDGVPDEDYDPNKFDPKDVTFDKINWLY